MKAAIIVGAGTVAGLATVLVLNPDDPAQSTSAALAEGPATAPSGGSSTSGSPEGPTASSGRSATPSGTFSGSEIQVRDWGVVQVEVTTIGGRISDVTALQAPNWDSRSAMISRYAVPELVSQAIDAQSADIAGVSGATFTSRAFAQSLQAALTRAGLA